MTSDSLWRLSGGDCFGGLTSGQQFQNDASDRFYSNVRFYSFNSYTYLIKMKSQLRGLSLSGSDLSNDLSLIRVNKHCELYLNVFAKYSVSYVLSDLHFDNRDDMTKNYDLTKNLTDYFVYREKVLYVF